MTGPDKNILPAIQRLLTAFLFLPAVVALAGSPHTQGEIILRDVYDCFEEGLTANDQLVFCEASALVFDGNRLTLASDKPVPGNGRSAVFSIPYAGSGPLTRELEYQAARPFRVAVKYEDMTLTPDGDYIIATTGFDRVKSNSYKWDGYNTMLVWPVGKPGDVKVVSATTNEGLTSSVSLRDKISQALISPDYPEGVPYFKVESLAAVPGNELLLGIRELGVRYDKFVYSFKILSVLYEINGGELSFTGDFELIYDFDTQDSSVSRQTTALSSIEYDKYHDRLYMLTSYENNATDEGLGGFLWTLSLRDLRDQKAPVLVTKASGDPLLFAHKSEGVTVLSADMVLVLHDDDRVLGRDKVENPETQFSKQAHQAAYSLVSIAAPGDKKPACKGEQ